MAKIAPAKDVPKKVAAAVGADQPDPAEMAKQLYQHFATDLFMPAIAPESIREKGHFSDVYILGAWYHHGKKVTLCPCVRRKEAQAVREQAVKRLAGTKSQPAAVVHDHIVKLFRKTLGPVPTKEKANRPMLDKVHFCGQWGLEKTDVGHWAGVAGNVQRDIENASRLSKLIADEKKKPPGKWRQGHKYIQDEVEVYESRSMLYTVVPRYMMDLPNALNSYAFFLRTPSDLQRTLRQVVEAVFFLHEHNIAHLDLAPRHIMFDWDANVKLVDFGTMEVFSAAHPHSTSSYGTPQFMAPERLSPHQTSGLPADVWALAATMYYAIMGQAPFAKQYAANLQPAFYGWQRSPFLQAKNRWDPSINLYRIVDPCLRVDAKSRPTLNWIMKKSVYFRMDVGQPTQVPVDGFVMTDAAYDEDEWADGARALHGEGDGDADFGGRRRLSRAHARKVRHRLHDHPVFREHRRLREEQAGLRRKLHAAQKLLNQAREIADDGSH